MNNVKKEKSFIEKFPNAIVLLFALIVIIGLASYVIPSGEYNSVEIDGKQVIDPNSFHIIEKTPLKPLDFFKAIPLGLQNASALIFMIFLIGGSISIFESTGAIEGAVAGFARKFGREKSSVVLILITTFFAFLGAFPGMLEAAIPFAPLCVGIAVSLGYDVIVGISITVISIVIGWTAGPTNPWTVGIGHNMAGLPMFSGIYYRLLVLLVLLIVTCVYILNYAKKVKNNPEKSFAYKQTQDFAKIMNKSLEEISFNTKHKYILLTFVATLAVIIYGTLKLKWGITEMSAFYIIGGTVAGLIAGYDANKIVDVFINGGKSIFGGAMAVGVARGISVIMEQANIIDSIVYYMSLPLRSLSPVISSVVMFIIQTVINFFIPSGSGQAMATLPIMLPLSEIINLSKQVAILAFQFGDGLSNLCYPTVAVVIAYLAYTKVPFSKWFKYIMPYMLITWIIAAVFCAVAVLIGY